ncbi:prophage CP4-57 regulatory [Chondrocystis sp. NIES-4102]|nr:prophage CP4-57 regulatory [Chondrocystis sp. NIES-4102]
MREYEFTLKFKLPDPNIDCEMYIDQLYESGCDDALIGIGKKGYLALNFIRESSSAYEAIFSAIKDVRKVIPQADIIEASPDLVGVTDLANLLGCTRQNIQKLISKDNSQCPPAVYAGAQSIWHLADILTWLVEYKNCSINESLSEIAKTTMNLNLAKQFQMLDPDMQENFKTLVVLK